MLSLVSIICLGADNYFFLPRLRSEKLVKNFKKFKNSAFPSRVMPRQTFVMSEARGLVVKVTEKIERCCFSVRRL